MQLLRRHWLLSGILLAVTLLVTGASVFILPWTYQAESNVVLIPSKESAKQFGGNPYLAFTGSVTDLGDVIRYKVTSKSEVAALQAEGHTSSYTVTDVVGTNAPVLLVTVTGSNPADVEQTLKIVTDDITTLLQQQQPGLSKSAQITDEVITFEPSASKMASKKARPVLIVFISCLLPAIVILTILDSVQNSRKKRKGRMAFATEGPAGTEDPTRHRAVQPNPEFDPMSAGHKFSDPADRGYADRGPADHRGPVDRGYR